MKKLLGALMVLSLLMSVIAYAPGGLAASAASSGGLSGGDSNASTRIGLFVPESAVAAAVDGQSAHQSVELAMKVANDTDDVSGRGLELVAYDDGSDSAQAASITGKLSTADKVDVVVSGSYSGPARVIAPIFQDAGIVMVAIYAIHPDVINAGDFIFSQSFPSSVQGIADAKLAMENLKAKKIAIVGVDLDFGRELSKYFKPYAEANNAKIISEDYMTTLDNDFTPVIPKVKSLNADMIYSVNYCAHAFEVVRQTVLQGLKVSVLGTEGVDPWQLLQTAGEYANGLCIATSINRDDKLESTRKYTEEYRAVYKMQPDMIDASIYDAFQVLPTDFKSVGTGNSAALHDCISSTKDFETITDKLSYHTKSCSAVGATQIWQVQRGTFHGPAMIDDSRIIDPTNY